MTRAKRHLHVLVPQRFYVSQQPGGGDRHVYATLTRFIPPAVEQHFQAIGPVAIEPVSSTASTGLADTRLDIAARLRAGWG
jgi:DNA helicase-2/ATP-dependent DNA helicase PcrA